MISKLINSFEKVASSSESLEKSADFFLNKFDNFMRDNPGIRRAAKGAAIMGILRLIQGKDVGEGLRTGAILGTGYHLLNRYSPFGSRGGRRRRRRGRGGSGTPSVIDVPTIGSDTDPTMPA